MIGHAGSSRSVRITGPTATWTRRTPWRGHDGSAAIEFTAGVALLLLPALLLVLSLPTWAEARTAAQVAAREAARTVVLAEDPSGPAAVGAAEQVAAEVLANRGQLPAGTPTFAWRAVTVDAGGSTVTQRHVEVLVGVRMPALSVPFIGRWASFDWHARHSEPLDLYRSLPAGAQP